MRISFCEMVQLRAIRSEIPPRESQCLCNVTRCRSIAIFRKMEKRNMGFPTGGLQKHFSSISKETMVSFRMKSLNMRDLRFSL